MPAATLAISSKRYLRIVERLMPVGFWAWNPATGEMAWSDGLARLLGSGRPSERLTMDDIISRTHPDDLWIIREKMRNDGGLESQPMRLRAADGSYRWFQCGKEQMERGGPKFLIGVFQDIHDARGAYSLLEQRQRILETLARMAGAIQWRSEPDGTLVVDHGWCDLTGTTLAVNQNKGWLLQLHPEDRQRAGDAWEAAVANATRFVLSYRVRRFDGAYVWMDVQAAPSTDLQGNIVEWIGFMMPRNGRGADQVDLNEEGRPTSRELKAARSILGLSIADLSEASGLSPATLSRFEASGGSQLRPSNRRKIREALAERGAVFGVDSQGRNFLAYRGGHDEP